MQVKHFLIIPFIFLSFFASSQVHYGSTPETVKALTTLRDEFERVLLNQNKYPAG
ncbi:hypothetical protein [Adhaeribacter aquaticus]|uniref:hypothetical protein n=1 Tax=Adhaeribacter aquaticus TaxID=299567 RepID=UPI0003FCC47E|nr:hypothetical protein [Adhaeribacter aquaticus]